MVKRGSKYRGIWRVAISNLCGSILLSFTQDELRCESQELEKHATAAKVESRDNHNRDAPVYTCVFVFFCMDGPCLRCRGWIL